MTAAAARPVPQSPVPHHLLGERYEVVGPLGRGGMAHVWLARDHLVGRDVALKVLEATLARSVEHRERFRREALIAARFPHPHIVQCYEWHCDRTAAVAVMRYVRGVTLADRLRSGPLPPREVCEVLAPVSDALAHLHRHGVVHRDVKPENILLQSEDDRPFLTDFGIATLLTSDQSRAEVVRRYGTPGFMAPEQLVGDWQADYRGDIYALGLVAFNALAGRLPSPRGLLDAPPLCQVAPAVPASLGRVIDRCLAHDPRRRWASADALRDALARAADREEPLWRRLLVRWKPAGTAVS